MTLPYDRVRTSYSTNTVTFYVCSFIDFIKPGLRFLYINVHVDTSDIMVEELVEPTNGKCMWSTLGVLNGVFMDCF